MAATSRQAKQRKGGPDAARRSAWTGARASPTFSPSTPSPRAHPAPAPTQQGPFSPLAQPNGARPDNPRDRVLQALTGLTGTTVTLVTKTASRFEGVVASTSTNEGDTTGVTLRDVKDLTAPGAPLKDQLFIASTNIESYTSGPADAKPANGDTFKTDIDISQKKANAGRERELQAWLPDHDLPPLGADDTFGTSGNTAWDQFTVNEQLFGITGGFNEEEYTTKLDRSAADFKERELKAQRIAAEILGTASNNPHIREERNIDDSGANEEDKYGAVVRGQGAYVPPGARRGPAGALSPPSTTVSIAAVPTGTVKQEIPKVAINGPDGSTVNQTQTPPDKTPSPSPVPAKDAPAAFRDFVTTEKQRLTRKRQALVKNDMDKRMAELVKFSQSFKLNKPIPDDLVPILAKDEEKQRLIKEKAKKDSESNLARAIGASTAVTASRGVGVGAPLKGAMKAAAAASSSKQQSSQAPIPPQKTGAGPTASKSDSAVKKIPMHIQAIPPFKGKAKQVSIHTVSATNGVNGSAMSVTTAAPTSASPAPMSPTTSNANRLNVNASSFRPNPKAAVSSNTGPPPMASATTSHSVASPKPKSESTVTTINNPFFGNKPLKKSAVSHIKDDFNPYKHGKVNDPSQAAPTWPYHGKRYAQIFLTVSHPTPHPTHMGPPVQPPAPPPPYEEDPNAQAAAARYVYPYPPYGYPAQHMMPGMAPGPPGTYMPGPFMQPMPYPPGMPPPAAMYSPAMSQMQPYMPPPPPGAYPPPPNGAGPRPSMPPTPIPTHAHPYYHHQSPQLQHAVPYPMMMQPPSGVPHPYENGPPPPVQMGGHA
ncbi:hypothetical protein AGABI2DRAFT_201859 [Agaricus bisporus var. bisporus H97]|uniref:hypothetical protein n=1 Tax=Agaricus bisporus var. bisporus (strain H97 / ATCC MYA-4626 / FGSC 10389) TaxID=936046 RepID=UPI00029F6C06|nr:hypothetical protein AGABI2DRAFT_201859 [Agaricus bisporus var. bisporus H97]EKV49447.1 hypothetical protein AGABI2DRAFT_201859 [Agaricus bisporus var. bisporus H97]